MDINRALIHYSEMRDELRAEEEVERMTKLLEVAALNGHIQADQLHDEVRRLELGRRGR